MSGKAVGWVFEHSPYSGDLLVTHLALADVANDLYDWEIWLSQEKLATKAKVRRETVSGHLKRLVEDGYLEVLDKRHGTTGRIKTYRFLFPGVIVSQTHYSEEEESLAQPGAIVSLTDSGPLIEPKENTSARVPFVDLNARGDDLELCAREFEECWKFYPRKETKQTALKGYIAWRRKGVAAEELLRATENYAAHIAQESRRPNWSNRFILQGQTFYGPNERWRDYAGPRKTDDGPLPWVDRVIRKAKSSEITLDDGSKEVAYWLMGGWITREEIEDIPEWNEAAQQRINEELDLR